MKMREWFGDVRQRLAALASPPAAEGRYAGAPPAGGEGAAIVRGLAGHNPELADVQEEVAAEQQGRVALASLCGELNCWLLATLREQAPLEAVQPLTREGFFTLVALPNAAAAPDGYELEGDSLLGMDCILYLCDYGCGWHAGDDRWYARLRAAGVPVLPVLVGPAPAGAGETVGNGDMQGALESMRRHLGIRPVLMRRAGAGPGAEGGAECGADGGARAVQELVDRILELRPRLAIPLAQEAPACRDLIARRVVRAASFMAALLGIEPLPLLDLPLTVLVQWKMALQLAAIYGRPGVEVLSREMAGTVGANLLVRTVAQQALKLLPILGWLLSAGLNFLSTWLLGQALASIYADEAHVRLPAGLARMAAKVHAPGWRPRVRLPRPRRKEGADV